MFHNGSCPICGNEMQHKKVMSVECYICSKGCWKEFSDNTTCNLYDIFDKNFAIWYHTDSKETIENKIQEIHDEIARYDDFAEAFANQLTADISEINRVMDRVSKM